VRKALGKLQRAKKQRDQTVDAKRQETRNRTDLVAKQQRQIVEEVVALKQQQRRTTSGASPGDKLPNSDTAWTLQEQFLPVSVAAENAAHEFDVLTMTATVMATPRCQVRRHSSSDEFSDSDSDDSNDGGRHDEYKFRAADAWDKRFTTQAAGVTASSGDTQQIAYDEWYISYESSEELRNYIRRRLKPHSLILQIGCGNSKLSENLYTDGYRHVCNLDLSEPLVEQMKLKYKTSHPGLQFVHGDALALPFPAKSFDAVIDKGTLQSILLLRGGIEKAGELSRQVWDVLRPGGRYVVVLGAGRGMEQYLKGGRLNWQISFRTIHEGTKRTGVNRTVNVFTFAKPRS